MRLSMSRFPVRADCLAIRNKHVEFIYFSAYFYKMKNTRKKNIQEIDGSAQRQYIDATSVFTALEEAKKNAAEVKQRMLTSSGTPEKG